MSYSPSRQVIHRSTSVPGRRSRRGVAVMVAIVAGLVSIAGCGTEDDGLAAGQTGEPTSSSSTTTEEPDDSGDDEVDDSGAVVDDDGATSPSDSPESTVASPADPMPEPELPGEVFEGFAEAGDELIAVGVSHDDVLNVREGPGVSFPIVAHVDPIDETVEATGRARGLTSSIWYEVIADGATGWANAGFLAYEGVVDDATAEIISSMGETPGAETMLDLGLMVAEDRSSDDVQSRVTVTVAPSVGDLGEVTYDVIGLADDALFGFRLHVFGQPSESGEGFGLKSVEQTALCLRGVTADGLCT